MTSVHQVASTVPGTSDIEFLHCRDDILKTQSGLNRYARWKKRD